MTSFTQFDRVYLHTSDKDNETQIHPFSIIRLLRVYQSGFGGIVMVTVGELVREQKLFAIFQDRVRTDRWNEKCIPLMLGRCLAW